MASIPFFLPFFSTPFLSLSPFFPSFPSLPPYFTLPTFAPHLPYIAPFPLEVGFLKSM